ncbi:uncharacterized protein Z518_08160 [Rhinocladiella mackenziei CBS 650.93]|uniref:RING-type domain-containing protein n=1 Tax=Rhinocladiella mackenziei CBS 650.93 TaxID=1442369 RepID=A0A0D2IG23_9EURO|nr:uncharacterized protein Z518_08160 [Rhinocladiella mackenziei CBS 650.93]KIX02221.1 hypothetical protein Z518_08160 [Rhinocladiella mackenziei CBS 650.93]
MAPITLPHFEKLIIRNVSEGDSNSNSSQPEPSSRGPESDLSALYLCPLVVIVVVILLASLTVWVARRRSKRAEEKQNIWREKRKESLLKSLPDPILWQPPISRQEKASSGEPGSQNSLNTVQQEQEICAFCLEEFKSSDMVQRLPQCQHFFHSACADEWMTRELQRSEKWESMSNLSEPSKIERTLRSISMTCPLCRKKLHEQSTAELTEPEPAHVRHGPEPQSMMSGSAQSVL